jgi:uncharacterized membrane protein
MSTLLLFSIICFTAAVSFKMERYVSWIGHVSSVCMIILIGMLLSLFGAVPSEHHVYDFFAGDAVPVALCLMLFGLHFKEAIRIPPRILVFFVVGVLGSVVGGLIAGALGFRELGPLSFKVAAQLTASYIGGGENAVAMQQMYGIPAETFLAVFAVDNIVTSVWMIFCLYYARQSAFSSDVSSKQTATLDKLNASFNVPDLFFSLFFAVVCVLLSNFAAEKIGGLHKVLYLSLFALLLGQIPFVQKVTQPSYLLGSTLFAGFFFSIGSMADITKLSGAPVSLALMPFVVVFVHASILFLYGKFSQRKPIEFGMVSQALIGGPATAVALVNSRKWTDASGMAVILGILGYALGNFCGSLVYSVLTLVFI